MTRCVAGHNGLWFMNRTAVLSATPPLIPRHTLSLRMAEQVHRSLLACAGKDAKPIVQMGFERMRRYASRTWSFNAALPVGGDRVSWKGGDRTTMTSSVWLDLLVEARTAAAAATRPSDAVGARSLPAAGPPMLSARKAAR